MTDPLFQFHGMANMTLPDVSHAPVCSQAPLGQTCCCCKRCGIGGCDIRVMDCGCCLHTRCCPLSHGKLVLVCPICQSPARTIKLLPMNFAELDLAQAEAAQMELSAKRGKKRQNATIARLQPKMNTEDGEAPDLRTGRWTTEETAYCDKLILLFEQGRLPIPDGTKLNDFLGGMLKSKQARLTKKMKNAKLSTRQYRHIEGYVVDDNEASEFSQLETDFFASIRCNMERSEIRFHMQKEWREMFSNYCVSLGQKLDADEWLCSVEEMDRRASVQKDAARMTRRKVMMGYALSHDATNPQQGVFIDPNVAHDGRNSSSMVPTGNYISRSTNGDSGSLAGNGNKRTKTSSSVARPRPLSVYSSPFLGRVIQYIHRHNLPFEHVDAWVPSLVQADTMGASAPVANDGQCRLCYAGCATTDAEIPPDTGAVAVLSSEDQFDLISFGVYSQKFSFEIGCGLPGRVYNSGVASWEQGIMNAPANLFERAGGAKQWGIQTVLGVPVASPNVGRVVVLFYSRYDRPRDDLLVTRIMDELTKLMPSPQWKLVVDIGVPEEKSADSEDPPEYVALLNLIQNHTPADKRSPLAEYLPGFTSLRLLLTEQTRSDREDELIQSAVESYLAYKTAGRAEREVAWMTARDFMVISKSKIPQVQLNSGVGHIHHGATPKASFKRNAAEGGTGAQAQNFASNVFSTQNGFFNSGSHGIQRSQGVGNLSSRGSSQNQLGHDFLFGLSPAMQPVPGGNQADLLSTLAPLGLSASQLSALLQSDNAFHGL